MAIDDEPGDARAEAADAIDPALDAGDRHAREPRGALVAADGEDLPAEQRALQHPGRDDHEHDHDDDLDRQPR